MSHPRCTDVRIKEKRMDESYKLDLDRTDKLVCILFALGIFLKQFYIFASGSMQPADLVMAIAIVICIVHNGIRIAGRDIWFLLFILLTIVINIIYSCICKTVSFIPSIIYMVYNLLLVIGLYKNMLQKRYFIVAVETAMKAALVSQLLVLVTDQGKWYGGVRFMSTFNDPNQFGFFVLSIFFCLFVMARMQRKKPSLLWLGLASFEVIISGSTSMMLGWGIFMIAWLLGLTRNDGITAGRFLVTVIALVLLLLVWVYKDPILDFLEQSKVPMIWRIKNRLKDAGGSSSNLFTNFIGDRSMKRIFIRPDYFLYGSGEGYWERFVPISGEDHELHSSFISLAYSYGLIPFIIFLTWLVKTVKGAKTCYKVVFLALVVEAFTLINYRQPLFWLIIMFMGCPECKKDYEESTISEDILGLPEID